MAEYCNDRFELVEDNEDSFGMWQGLVGPHYTPIMSNDGTLSWTNNGFLPNPDSVNLRGPQGAGLTIAGIRESTAGLPESAAAGVVWLVGTEEPYEGYSYINDEWIDLGPMTVGPAGPPGPQGDDYTLTSADKTEIAGEAEQLLLNDLNNNPLPVTKGGTGAQTLAGAQENLGITDLADQIGDTPLATDAQDIRGAINELVGDLGSLDFDTSAQDVTGAVNELAAGKVSKAGDTMTGDLAISKTEPIASLKHTSIDSSAASDTSIRHETFALFDKNGNYIGYVQGNFYTNGTIRLALAARRIVNGADVTNYIYLDVSKDGVKSVTLSDPEAWRNAIGASSGGGVLYYQNQAVNIATNAQIMRIPSSGTDSNITTDTIVLDCFFSSKTNVLSDVSWQSYDGYIVFTGTVNMAITANVVLGNKAN